MDWWAKTKPSDPMRAVLTNRPYYLHDVGIPWGNFRKPDDGPLIDAWFALSAQVFEQLYRDATPPRRLALLKEKLSFAILRDKAGIAAILPQMQQLVGNEPIPPDSDSVAYADYALLVMSAAEVNHWRVRRQPLKASGEPAILLGNEGELAVWLAKLYANVLYSTDSAAALELLSFLDRWPPSMSGPDIEPFPFPRTAEGDRHARAKLRIRSYFHALRSRVLERYPDIVVAYLNIVLQNTGESGDATNLIRLGRILLSQPIGIPADQQEQLSARLLAAISGSTHSAQAHEVAALAGFANRLAPRETKRSFDFEERQGAWRAYSRVPIKLTRKNLAAAFVDRRPDAQRAGGEIVLLRWSAGSCQIERVGINSNTARQVGPDIPSFKSQGYQGYQMAFGPNKVFVTSGEGGFAIVRNDSFEVFSEEHGAPSSEIWSMAWCNERLYIGYRDAFASFDPQTKTFQLLDSSAAIDPKTPIDGRGSFFVRYLHSDEPNRCLWMFIQDNAADHARSGLWKFDLQSATYQKLDTGHYVPMRTEDGLLLYNYPAVSYLDTKTATLTKLTGYAPVVNGHLTPPAAIKVNDHIITKSGALYTPEGEVHRLQTNGDWKWLQRAGPGFITHYDESSGTLWYFKPNSSSTVGASR